MKTNGGEGALKAEKYNVKGPRVWLSGALSGVANGLFGSGGGVVCVVTMERLLGIDEHVAHASTIAVILPLSAISLAIYSFSAQVDYLSALYVALGSVPGGLVGAWILGKLKGKWVNRLLCAFMFAAAVRILFD